MTTPQQPAATPTPYSDVAPTARPGRSLAAAIAVFLGGYLILLSFTGRLVTVSQNVFASALGRGVIEIEPPLAALYVLQFVFALVVVVVGLFLSGPRDRAVVGSIIVVVATVGTLVVLGGWITGAISFPPREAGVAVRAFVANYWFATVASVGIAWLLTRRPGAGWLAILAAAVLIPLPTVFVFQGVDFATTSLVLFAVSAIVGGGIILAGRPLRD